MVAVPTKSHTRIEVDRRYHNYETLKAHFSKKSKDFKEVIFDGVQTATGTLAEVTPGPAETIAFNGATTTVFIASEADLAGLDADSIWIDYATSVGVLHEGVETLLDSETSTATEVPVGSISGLFIDAVAAVNGDALTMTGLNRTKTDDLAGWYVIGCGDATHRPGQILTILSNTAASPTVITCTSTPNADWADDNVSVQPTQHPDVYRIRRMYAETESPTDNYQCVCDKDQSNIYGVIADANTYGGAGSRYFALDSNYRCFIGQLLITAPLRQVTDGEAWGYQVSITFTPLSKTGQASADITLAFDFQQKLVWEPCIELEPATDVIVKIKAILNDAAFYEIGVRFTCLELTL